ncbi:MAG: Gfo/Idh/MocA family oxidoreductase [Bryobacterales bacterium]|nr:Gfo/Idh/MocA family oxidoreductase [Bryobacterales bacterium]
MSREWKGAMVGAGFFAAFHAEAWQRIPGARISSMADLDADKARAFAERWRIERVYSDAAEMLDKEQPDFLDVVTGPGTHAGLTAMAAQRGIPVFCQKPMAPTWEECERMVEACDHAGVRLLIHENWRWQPWYREMRRIADSGALGRVFHYGFQMRTGDGRGEEPYTVQPYFRGMRRFLLFETVVHFLDTFRYLGGEMQSVYCATSRINPLIAGEDYAQVHVAFASGANGWIDANRISGPQIPETAFGVFRMEGDAGMIRMTPGGHLWLTRYGEAEHEHAFAVPRHGYKGDSVHATQSHLLECLRTGRPCESEGRDYLKTVRAVMACYASAETGQAVRL